MKSLLNHSSIAHFKELREFLGFLGFGCCWLPWMFFVRWVFGVDVGFNRWFKAFFPVCWWACWVGKMVSWLVN